MPNATALCEHSAATFCPYILQSTVLRAYAGCADLVQLWVNCFILHILPT